MSLYNVITFCSTESQTYAETLELTKDEIANILHNTANSLCYAPSVQVYVCSPESRGFGLNDPHTYILTIHGYGKQQQFEVDLNSIVNKVLTTQSKYDIMLMKFNKTDTVNFSPDDFLIKEIGKIIEIHNQ